LLDINMPGMDGYQVLEVLKADARLQAIPVIAVTANAMPRDIERGRAVGFADYLTKPLDIGHFNRVVDACLENPAVALSGPGGGQ
ncbi:MAG TPA: response regulator, partial [Thiobacillus sp.]|nr:response regulator [Thiobacillus sp.]